MTEREEILISLGAAVAAGCVSCYGYFSRRAEKAGFTEQELADIIKVGEKVKKGSMISFRKEIGIRNLQCNSTAADQPGKSTPCCC